METAGFVLRLNDAGRLAPRPVRVQLKVVGKGQRPLFMLIVRRLGAVSERLCYGRTDARVLVDALIERIKVDAVDRDFLIVFECDVLRYSCLDATL